MLGEAPLDLVEIDHFLVVARAQERIGTRCRQHAIDHQAADRNTGFLELFNRAGGLFDRQPLSDQHQHERADPRAEQAGAELTQVLEALGQFEHHRIGRIVLLDAEHRVARLGERANPRLHQLGHADQPQRVPGRGRVEHDQVEARVFTADQAANAIE